MHFNFLIRRHEILNMNHFNDLFFNNFNDFINKHVILEFFLFSVKKKKKIFNKPFYIIVAIFKHLLS